MIAPLSKLVNGKSRVEDKREQQARRAGHERIEKRAAKLRDKHTCRFPGCDWKIHRYALHVAHLEDKGMGGDKKGTRSMRSKLITLCAEHHVGPGPVSLHSERLRITPLTTAGTDGPCAFTVHLKDGCIVVVGVN